MSTIHRLLRLSLAMLPLIASTHAYAQSTLLQGGPFLAGHALMYAGQGSSQAVVQDSGPAGGGGTGLGLSELLLVARGTGTPPYVAQGTGPFGTNLCDYDAPISNATGFHYLCFSANAGAGGGLIAYGAGGSAAALPLTLRLNGSSYQFPFSISGILGPSTTVIGNLPLWNNTAGTLLSDSGVAISSLAPLNSPAFSGTPTAPTATPGTNTTQISTTAFSIAAAVGTVGYGTIIHQQAAGNVTAPATPALIFMDKTVPATTVVTLPAASNWPNCTLQLPAACPTYRIKDYARNSGTFATTVLAADSAQFDGVASFIISSNGAEYGFTLVGTNWSVN